MRQRINPNQIILGMMPKACPECKHIQHVWFKTTEEFDNWSCPVCAGRIEPDEIDVDTEGSDTDRNGESEDPKVSALPEDSEEKQGFERPSTKVDVRV